MAAKETSGQPPGPGGTGEPGEAGDVGAILDDMDEALEENPEEVIRSFKQEGGE
ncbi:MAG TPA: ubiquitin-like protein Pup [Streptosporangiaceae bacterium]|jgi:ubiquitin-like protein Pup|nr:ubiquitin-like protein Pup [Streptosporangiaceae bacterium]